MPEDKSRGCRLEAELGSGRGPSRRQKADMMSFMPEPMRCEASKLAVLDESLLPSWF